MFSLDIYISCHIDHYHYVIIDHYLCKVGDVTVVSELLGVGYRNIDAKNHDSQTALHIASYHGHVEVMQYLIKHKASIDQSEHSALHVTCLY